MNRCKTRSKVSQINLLHINLCVNVDRALKRWWAQFMESTAEMETALQFYQAAQDILSLVRVYCYCNNMDKVCKSLH